jgi:nitrate/TMAO reductase-like tetraheme cytochrome c subunit
MRKTRRALSLAGVLLIVVGCLLFFGATHPIQSQEESTCISCHTSVRELVRITREIAAKNPSQKSVENKGEG